VQFRAGLDDLPPGIPWLSACLALQRHRQRYAQTVGLIVEGEGAIAALRDRLDDGQAQAAAAAGGVSPEAPGQVLEMLGGDARALVAYFEAHSLGFRLQGQRDGAARCGVALGIFQQVTQRGDGQHRRHGQRRVG